MDLTSRALLVARGFKPPQVTDEKAEAQELASPLGLGLPVRKMGVITGVPTAAHRWR